MRKIAVTLSKGGVGKSTSATNLAHGLAQSGYKVLIIDTDTQGQVAEIFGQEPGVGLAEVLAEEVQPEDALMAVRDNLWVLAGGRQLASAKRLLARQEFGGERMMAKMLAPYDEYFDYAILDTAPGWDALTIGCIPVFTLTQQRRQAENKPSF